MNVSLGARWESFIESILKAGRYSSASEVVREGLRQVDEREAKLAALREALNASIERGGEFGDVEVSAHLDAELIKLADQGF